MPTIYRNDNSVIKVTAPKEFTDRVRAAQDEVIVANKISKMQFNLKHQEYQELFAQYKRQQEEHKQRLQRIIEQQQQQNRRQQHQQQSQQPRYVDNSSSSNRENNNNSSNVTLRNLKLMQRIAGPNP